MEDGKKEQTGGLPDYKHTPLPPPKESKQFNEKDYKGYEIVKPFGEDEIQKHAAKCGGRRLLKQIPVTTDDGYCFVYLVQKPTRNVIKAINSKKKGDKPDEDAIEKLMMGLVLEGDMDTLENDGSVYSELGKNIGGLVRGAKGAIKEA